MAIVDRTATARARIAPLASAMPVPNVNTPTAGWIQLQLLRSKTNVPSGPMTRCWFATKATKP
ncbi:hypothetical protein BA062_35765 [Prauserella flavalba]|uniref:Uncharacterized protein n=1 Tax=Prauserella flavalba TaxID=1477506 RepID=A0A318LD55_9PSEU|nr:hypothetical protein BA062_35765 [Prauserella flavalba]